MRAEIKLNRGYAIGSSLVVGGIDLSNHTTALQLRRTRNGEVELTVELVLRSIEAQVDADIVIPEEIGTFLTNLGWIPPAATPQHSSDKED